MATVEINGQKARVCDYCRRGFVRRGEMYCSIMCAREACRQAVRMKANGGAWKSTPVPPSTGDKANREGEDA